MNMAWKIIRGILIAVGILALVSILAVSCSISALDNFLSGSSSGSAVMAESKTYDITEAIDGLEIEVAAAEVKIQQGQEFSVETNGKYIVCETRNGVLTVKEKNNYSLIRNGYATVSITIPEGTAFRHVSLETGACQVLVDDLYCETLELEMGAGELVIDRLYVTSSADIQGGAGRLSIGDGEIRGLDLDMGIGELELCARLLDNADIDLGTGSAALALIGTQDDYQIRMDTGLGSAKLEQTPMKDGTVYGSGENRIRIDGGIGDIEIKFVAY